MSTGGVTGRPASRPATAADGEVAPRDGEATAPPAPGSAPPAPDSGRPAPDGTPPADGTPPGPGAPAPTTELSALAEQVSQLATRLAAVERAVNRAAARMDSRSRDATRDVEALLQLYRERTPRAPMPPSGRWAMDPTGLLELLSRVPADRPALVLELGSGTSSVWLGYALERTGGRLVSLDHDPRFGERTRQLLGRHALTGVAQVRDAPLRDLDLGDGTYRWYDPAAFEDLAGVDLLVVDGPPGTTGPLARYPALPVLWRRLSPGALVLLDDVDRPDERDTADRWLAEIGGLTEEPAAVGNVAVLRYAGPAAQPR